MRVRCGISIVLLKQRSHKRYFRDTSMKIYSFWINNIEHRLYKEQFIMKNVGSSNMI